MIESIHQKFKPIETIYQSRRTVVYRAVRETDRLPVILKTRNEPPGGGPEPGLAHEYALAKTLEGEHSAGYLALEHTGQKSILVLRDDNMNTLKPVIPEGGFDLPPFLKLAAAVTSAIEEIHAANIVHKDINPSNILWDPAAHRLKIIDFDIALRLPREKPAAGDPEHPEGTLAYLSPEQTGRIERTVDYRTDLYSLGVTFYEMLTGQLPFTAADAMELVHCHIAKTPVPPHAKQPNIPKAISEIVMKLLEKSPDHRYQGAPGLAYDLAECTRQMHKHGKLTPFPLGSRDIPGTLQIPEKLYGRKKEIDTLAGAFERTSRGTIEAIFVSGSSGVGKSALVDELRNVVIRRGGFFASGKFDQVKKNIAYSAISRLFQDLLRQFVGEGTTKRDRWKEKLSAAVGSNGRLAAELIPGLEALIGPQPPIESRDPTEIRNRFNQVFVDLINVFAREEHPVVMFLDDLQWADRAGLDLMKQIAAHTDTGYLLFIAAYRNDGPYRRHPGTRLADTLSEEGVPVLSLDLSSLDRRNTNRLIADSLRLSPSETAPLSEPVYKKTGGIPFFVGVLLRSIFEEGILNFSHKHGWRWDIEAVRQMPAADNVVELMVHRIDSLPPRTRELLILASALGHSFNHEDLAILSKKPREEIDSILQPVLKAGMLVKKSRDISGFIHDRVQEASYSYISEEEGASFHLRIGRSLLEGTPKEERSARLHEIVGHMNTGGKILESEDERTRLAEMNLAVGTRVKNAAGYTEACEYLAMARSLLPGDPWKQCYDLTFPAFTEGGECEYLAGDYEKSSVLLNQALEHAASPMDKGRVYLILIIRHSSLGEYPHAVQAGIDALTLLGIELPGMNDTHAIHRAFEKNVETYRRHLGNRPIIELAELPVNNEDTYNCAMRILSAILDCALHGVPQYFGMSASKMVALAVEQGNSRFTPLGCSCMAIALLMQPDGHEAAFEFGRTALEVHRNIAYTPELSGKILNGIGGFTNHLKNHIGESIAFLDEAFDAGLESGDYIFASYSAVNRARAYISSGLNLEGCYRNSEAPLGKIKKFGIRPMEALIGIFNGFALNLMGKTAASSFDHEGFSQAGAASILAGAPILLEQLHFYRLQAFYFRGDYESASEFVFFHEHPLDSIYQGEEIRLFAALTLTALYPDREESEKKKYWEYIQNYRDYIAKYSRLCPANFGCHQQLVGAEIARLEKNIPEAMDLYDRAIASAGANGFLQYEALSNELAARFWFAEGKEKFGRLYLDNARRLYREWGAEAVVRRLEKKYPETAPHPPGSESHPVRGEDKTYGKPGNHLDLMTVVKVSQAISAEIGIDGLLSRIMGLIIENAGAQRGFLVLTENGNAEIAARVTTGDEPPEPELPVPLEGTGLLSVSIVQYVHHNSEMAILHDAAHEGPFINDPYVVKNRPKSILCTPILRENKSVGILYLENNLTCNVFTASRVELLHLVLTQVAISLENARLYKSKINLNEQLLRQIHDRERAENELRNLRNYLSNIIDSMPSVLVGVDVQGNVTQWNKTAERITGTAAGAAQGKPLSHVFPRMAPEMKKITESIRTRETKQERKRPRQSETGVRYEDVTIYPLAADGVEGAVIRIDDVTARVHMEEMMIQGEKMLSVGGLAAGMAHEINNPLAAIMGAAGVMATRLSEPSNIPANREAAAAAGTTMKAIQDFMEARGIPRMLTAINESGRRVAGIVDNMLSFARKSDTRRSSHSLVELLDKTLELAATDYDLKKHYDFKAIEIKKEYEAGLPCVPCEGAKLQQVLFNIFRNGAQAMQEAGTTNPRFIVRMRIEKERKMIRIEIEDNGPGMDEETRKRVFEPFFTTKPVGVGTGLGLSVSYFIITENHGGEMAVESQPGSGAKFTIRLPLEGRGGLKD